MRQAPSLGGTPRVRVKNSGIPLSFPSSTIGSEELNFRVRNGIGCGLFDIATESVSIPSAGRPIASGACVSAGESASKRCARRAQRELMLER
jgi:hypothetical protein